MRDTSDIAMSESNDEEEEDVVENFQEVVYSPELLGMYYARLFPYHFLTDWLSYDPTSKSNEKLFNRREFSFTIEVGGEEVYIRYQSYSNPADFQAAILQRKPMKIDIGAVFSHPPKDHKSVSKGFKTQQRELVFDIDLTDYDGVRNCGCSGAKICRRCWQMMTMAVEVMDQGLREDFDFEHIAWFYSGRRGVHAWVCDEGARNLTNEARSAVASYFEVSLGTDKNKSVGISSPLHPMMTRAYNVLEPHFIHHILPSSGHCVMATEDKWTALLKTLPEAASRVGSNLEKEWKKSSSSPAEKWAQLKQRLERLTKPNKAGGGKSAKTISSSDRQKIELWPIETVFRYTYPRLDINVSKMQNHLLKSPFCVHPKTGRVCVPIQVQKVRKFDPFKVPTLAQLMKELDEYDEENGKVKHEWQKTSLRPTFEAFQKEFLDPMSKELRRKQRDLLEEQAAMKGDF